MPLTRDQVRELDRRAAAEFGLSTLVLMENAGRGVADVWSRLNWSAPVAICCGVGNNGGDGFVAARHLDARGVEVRVAVVGERAKLTPESSPNLAVIEQAGLNIQWFASAGDEFTQFLSGAGSIVDALLGVGAHGEPRPPLDRIIEQMNRSGLPILAVDLPSGLDCDTGQPAVQTIRAMATCTFVAPKQGFAAPQAQHYLGTVHVADIGAPRKLVEEILGQSSNQSAVGQALA
ncbi:MAG: NAD(P)H-hydrate epimerase [Planctomycetes bacterium]|nr:NAD(P)H-hydrate epimerase [Planctomycetota bacterium]